MYSDVTIERLRFIAGARRLGFHLEEIGALLTARDKGKLRCGQTLDSLESHLQEIDCRIADLLETRAALLELHTRGKKIPRQQQCDDKCVCYHITADRAHNTITITSEEVKNG